MMDNERVMTTPLSTEKFATADLNALRNDLLQTGVDSFQAAELIASFLSGRGYGVSQEDALAVATRIEAERCSTEKMQVELESIALTM